MDLSSIIPLLSNFTNKNNLQQNAPKNTQNSNFSSFYPDETFDGHKITVQSEQPQQQNPNGLLSLLPKLLTSGNLDLSSLTSVLGANSNLFSTLLNKTEDKKTNPPKISEFVKVDEYDLN